MSISFIFKYLNLIHPHLYQSLISFMGITIKHIGMLHYPEYTHDTFCA